MRRRVANKVVNKSSASPNHKYKLGTVLKAGQIADIRLVQRGRRRMMIQMLEQYIHYVIDKYSENDLELSS